MVWRWSSMTSRSGAHSWGSVPDCADQAFNRCHRDAALRSAGEGDRWFSPFVAMRPCVQVLASDQRYYAIVTRGGPGSNPPKWLGTAMAAAAGLAREAGMTQQAVTGLVPECPVAASEKPAEPGDGGDEALVADDLLVEEVSIDGMCGVYWRAGVPAGDSATGFDLDRPWRVDERVAVRHEPFGALLYHFGTRRLSFLKEARLLAVLRVPGQHPTACCKIRSPPELVVKASASGPLTPPPDRSATAAAAPPRSAAPAPRPLIPGAIMMREMRIAAATLRPVP
jgi:mycofactocin precursor